MKKQKEHDVTNYVKSMRRSFQLTQAQMAELLSCKRSSIASYESGRVKMPDRMLNVLKTIERISDKAVGDALTKAEYGILDLVGAPVFIVGPDLKIRYWNSAMAELTGIEAEAALGTTVYENLFETKHLKSVLKKGIPYASGQEYMKDTPEGMRLVRISSQSHETGSGPETVITLFDITDRAAVDEKVRDLTDASLRDAKTGLYNSDWLRVNLESEKNRIDRYGGVLSFMMLDLDHFKDVNDRYGHSNGDVALLRFVDVIKKSIRGTDVPYRYGGEEFAVILFGTSGEEAVIVAERIRQRQEKNVLLFGGEKVAVTVSIGVAQYRKGESPKDLIDRADRAVYEAKKTGRNRVVFDGPPSPSPA